MNRDDIENFTNSFSDLEFNYQRPSDLVLIPTELVTLTDVLIFYTVLKFKYLIQIPN